MERKIGKSTLTPILFSGCDVYVKNSSNLNSTTFFVYFPCRYYYKTGILERVDRRLVYKFGKNAHGWQENKIWTAQCTHTCLAQNTPQSGWSSCSGHLRERLSPPFLPSAHLDEFIGVCYRKQATASKKALEFWSRFCQALSARKSLGISLSAAQVTIKSCLSPCLSQ